MSPRHARQGVAHEHFHEVPGHVQLHLADGSPRVAGVRPWNVLDALGCAPLLPSMIAHSPRFMGSPSPRSASHSEPAARRSSAISSRRPAASGSTTTVRMDFRVLSTPSAAGSMPACSVWRTRSTVASVVDSIANGMTPSVRMPNDSPDRHEPKHAMMNGASSEIPCRRPRMSFASASVYRRLERSRVLRVGMVYFTVAANGSMSSTTKPDTVT